MDLNLLDTFMKVYLNESYSKASEEIGISQSAVSQRIKKLEGELGKGLFVKKGRTIEATSYAHHMAQKLGSLRDLVREAIHDVRYKVYIQEALVYGLKNVNAILIDAPKSEDTLINDLRSRKVDLVVDSVGIVDACIIREEVATERMVMIASGSHPRIQGEITPAEFYSEQHIALATRRSNSDLFNLITVDPQPRDIVYRTNSVASLMLYVSSSDYLGFVPQSMSDYAKSLQLQIIKPPFELQPITFNLLYHRSFEKDIQHRVLRKQIMKQLQASFT
ncbi:LysR family transcriptional regulator [Vibrio lamellibrachiae]|uniref:LysR family transcriptional regulator n=1 Tax=Vibrio lamellibrachiae TaxID=2910253 RepID=UPI003D1143D5